MRRYYFEIQATVRRWLLRWPLVKRSTMYAAESKARDAGRREVQDTLAKERETIERIIARMARIEYRREGREYAMTVRFAPEMMMFGAGERRELDYLAHEVARKVEREIATSRFIRDADDYDRARGPFPGVGARFSMADEFRR